MNLSIHNLTQRCTRISGRLSSLLVSALCVLRGLPLLIAARPRTPLRVMCIMAFDIVHTLRTSQRLRIERVRTLALLLDFGANANSAFDGKTFCPDELRKTRRMLDDAGINATADDYWARIQELESRRPSAFGDRLQCGKVRSYRENVVELSLAVLSTTALGYTNIDDGVNAVRTDADLQLLFRIAMQCQIIDDVMDFAKDCAWRLPGFLTASESLRESFELTYHAARRYSSSDGIAQSRNLFPLRIAQVAVSGLANLLITLGRWRQRVPLVQSLPELR